MAKAPRQVDIRSYQVGFGDCFLLSFVYSDDDTRHVLIDFGSTALPGRSSIASKPSQHMPLVANHIRDVCNGERLTAVIATHRHADHINGFGTDGRTGRSGEIIRDLRPRVVLQPWTEDPRAARDARRATSESERSRKSFVAGIRDRQNVAAMIHDVAASKPAWMSAAVQRELSFLGLANIANESAVRNLIAMGEAPGAKAVWARHGSRTGLERLLPGVKIRVLGPPDLTQSEAIRTARRKDPDQFWHLLAGTGGRDNPFRNGVGGNGTSRTNTAMPLESRWFRNRLDRMRGSQLLEIVRTLDKELNNTSLILLFEVFGRKLLFPGDAQIENWSYALLHAPDRNATRRALAGVDVYKVGHHGSLNATPKKLLWEAFTKRGNGQLTTLLSTMSGKHGRTANRTEVPRRTLVGALQAESELRNTQKLPLGMKTFRICDHLTVVPGKAS